MRTNNPRYPHTCVIYRIKGATQFSEGEKVSLYEGEGRKESNTSIRNFYSNNVPKTDYRVSMPGFVEGILPGDMIDIKDRVALWAGILITDVNISNFGTEIFFNISKN